MVNSDYGVNRYARRSILSKRAPSVIEEVQVASTKYCAIFICDAPFCDCEVRRLLAVAVAV